MVSISLRAATSLAAFGLTAGSALFLAAPATALEGPACDSYSSTAQSDTTVVITTGDVDFGDVFAVTASVTSDGQPIDGGEVVFDYRGTQKVVPVEDGEASTTFVARRGSQDLTARYLGVCLNGEVAIAGSEGAQILGAEAFASPPGNDGGDGPVVAGVEGLADTGLTPGVQLVGLAGAGLLVAGAATLMIRRRAVTI